MARDPDREKRLAEALRENLRRRKAQRREADTQHSEDAQTAVSPLSSDDPASRS